MRRIASCFLGLVLTVTIAAGAGAQQTAKVKRKANEISRAELQDPAVAGLTMMAALQRLRPNWLLNRGASDLGMGGAMGAQNNGVSSACRGGSGSCSAIGENTSQNPPGLFVDEVKQDFQTLTKIRASDVTSAVYVNAADATTRFGTGYPNGAVLLSTKN